MPWRAEKQPKWWFGIDLVETFPYTHRSAFAVSLLSKESDGTEGVWHTTLRVIR